MSIWRYSHVMLAVSSSIFILIASLSGIVLTFEPISHQLTGHNVSCASDVSLAETLYHLHSEYDEILSMEVDENNFVAVSVIDKEGNTGDFYVDPFTGKKLGDIVEKSPIFEWATSLHRSLFLKGLGRFFIGLSAFLLMLIALTGTILIIKRQQGVRYLLSRILHENFFQYYHVYLGRLLLIPIIIISLSGTYLSLQRFSVVPEGEKASYDIDFDAMAGVPVVNYRDFAVFKSIKLSEVRAVEFPFSEDVEDYYTLKLKTKEVLVNQYTGQILGQYPFPLVTLLSNLSLSLHTGRGSIWWSVVLLISACSMLFFVYSGFALTLERRSVKIKNKFGKDECKYVILVGSETGSTMSFAMQLHQMLLELGETSYITEMNRYTSFKEMEHLVVVTSTYGQGEAPTNANKFISRFKQHKPSTSYRYSVVGFGSLAYPEFCRFAMDVNAELQNDARSLQLLELCTINNRSWEAYRRWARQWGNKVGLTLNLPARNPVVPDKKKKELFKVVHKTQPVEHQDETFLIQLEPAKTKTLDSGDLVAIYPPNGEHERLYSMAITNKNQILLSVKRHEKGICSNYLNNLQLNETIEASIVKNKQFHFPTRSKRVIFVCTGTGIAPFLGMLEQNHSKIETHLYWGGRNERSFELYKAFIDKSLESNTLSSFHPAYSRAASTKTYVQHLLKRDCQLIAQTLQEKGVIMICGSIAMQREVTKQLEEISVSLTGRSLSYYQNKNRLRIDCY